MTWQSDKGNERKKQIKRLGLDEIALVVDYKVSLWASKHTNDWTIKWVVEEVPQTIDWVCVCVYSPENATLNLKFVRENWDIE